MEGPEQLIRWCNIKLLEDVGAEEGGGGGEEEDF